MGDAKLRRGKEKVKREIAREVMVEESEEELPGQRRMLLTLILLCGLQGATAQVDGDTGEALCHKM